VSELRLQCYTVIFKHFSRFSRHLYTYQSAHESFAQRRGHFGT